MTLVNMTSIFSKPEFKEFVEDFGNNDKTFMDYVNKCMSESDFVESLDYGQILKARRKFMNRPKPNWNNNINWFGQNK